MKRLISGLLLVILPYITDALGLEIPEESLAQFADILATILGAFLLIIAPAGILKKRNSANLLLLSTALILGGGVTVTSFTGCETIRIWSKTPMGTLAIKAIPVLILESNPALAPYVQLLGQIMVRSEATETPREMSLKLINELKATVDISPAGLEILSGMTDSLVTLMTDYFTEYQGKLLEADKDRILREIGTTLDIIGSAYMTSSSAGSAVAVERKVQLSAGYVTIE